MGATTRGKTYQFEDYKGWQVAVARDRPKAWHGFAKPPGDPHAKFTLSTLNGGPMPSRETAMEAIRAMVDNEGS